MLSSTWPGLGEVVLSPPPGLYAGIKFFLIDFIFKRCPRLRAKYDTPYIIWKSLPTDPQLKERSNAAAVSRRVSPPPALRSRELPVSAFTLGHGGPISSPLQGTLETDHGGLFSCCPALRCRRASQPWERDGAGGDQAARGGRVAAPLELGPAGPGWHQARAGGCGISVIATESLGPWEEGALAAATPWVPGRCRCASSEAQAAGPSSTSDESSLCSPAGAGSIFYSQ